MYSIICCALIAVLVVLDVRKEESELCNYDQ